MPYPNWHDRATVAPTSEPLAVSEANDHLRIDQDDENDYIADLIKMAREQVENDTSRALMTQTRVLTLDRFPNEGDHNVNGVRFGYGGMIMLPRAPVQSVSSIAYYDGSGALQTLSSSLYAVDATSEPARITPVYGSSWPTTQARPNAVAVTYVAGWTSAALVPARVKHLMRLWVAHFYENREPVNIGNIVNVIPMAMEALTASCKWGSYT